MFNEQVEITLPWWFICWIDIIKNVHWLPEVDIMRQLYLPLGLQRLLQTITSTYIFRIRYGRVPSRCYMVIFGFIFIDTKRNTRNRFPALSKIWLMNIDRTKFLWLELALQWSNFSNEDLLKMLPFLNGCPWAVKTQPFKKT